MLNEALRTWPQADRATLAPVLAEADLMLVCATRCMSR